jgi:hypothetical protein
MLPMRTAMKAVGMPARPTPWKANASSILMPTSEYVGPEDRRTMRAFARRAYHPSARRVYQPTALPERARAPWAASRFHGRGRVARDRVGSQGITPSGSAAPGIPLARVNRSIT